MKYNEQKFTKFIGGTGFFAIVACCVLIIGAATWFAVSRFNKTEPQTEQSPKNAESYTSDGGSYNDIGDIGDEISSAASDIAEDVTNSVSDEPYSESSEAKAEEIKNESFIYPADGKISKGYSETELQYSATYGDMRLHTGVDIACEKGASVKAMGVGKVVSVEENTTFGGVITVDHGSGITVKYCGVENVTVEANDKISQGEIIGAAGTVPCECADQSHIHIEMLKNGKTVSPNIE